MLLRETDITSGPLWEQQAFFSKPRDLPQPIHERDDAIIPIEEPRKNKETP